MLIVVVNRFDVDNSFLFQLPVAFQQSCSSGGGGGLGSLEEEADSVGPAVCFRIMDKVTFGADMELASAVLPLASLQGQVQWTDEGKGGDGWVCVLVDLLAGGSLSCL